MLSNQTGDDIPTLVGDTIFITQTIHTPGFWTHDRLTALLVLRHGSWQQGGDESSLLWEHYLHANLLASLPLRSGDAADCTPGANKSSQSGVTSAPGLPGNPYLVSGIPYRCRGGSTATNRQAHSHFISFMKCFATWCHNRTSSGYLP